MTHERIGKVGKLEKVIVVLTNPLSLRIVHKQPWKGRKK